MFGLFKPKAFGVLLFALLMYQSALAALTPQEMSMIQQAVGSKSSLGSSQAQLQGNNTPAFNTATTKNNSEATRNISPSSNINLADLDLSPIERMFSEMDQQGYKKMPILQISSEESSENITMNIQIPPQLPISRQYGYDIFSGGNASGSFVEFGAPVGPDYILGPGDSLTVNIYGKIQQQLDLTIDRSGRVYVPQVGTLYLWGVRNGDVAGIIKNKLAKNFTNFQVSVSLGQLRSITVYALGDVVRPGTYTLSSLATAFQLLYVAGGPTKMGTFRKVQIVRNKRIVGTIDLYQYFLTANRTQDNRLQDGDTLFVPVIGKVAKVAGTIKRPAIYELNAGDSVADLLSVAGGMTATGYYKRVQIERVVQGEKRIAIDLTFKSPGDMLAKLKKEIVLNGDVITILPIAREIRNYVSIQGNIRRPGNYGIESGMTIKELIKSADGLLEESDLNRVEVYRFLSDQNREIVSLDLTQAKDQSFALKEWDIVQVKSKYSNETISINGAVKVSGKYKLLKNMRLADIVSLAEPTDFADIKRIEVYRRSLGKQPEIILVNLKVPGKPMSSSENILLKNNDQITIRSDEESASKVVVNIAGEVQFPGTYYIQKGEKISSVIARAGGYSRNAFLEGAKLTRESIKKSQLLSQKQILDQERKRVFYDRTNTYGPEVLSYLESSLAIAEGRILIRFKPIDEFQNSSDDLILEDKDDITIPPIPTYIQLVGGVTRPTVFLYQAGKDAMEYINMAGGFGEFADRGNIYLVKPNGIVSRDLRVVGPGDLIYISEVPREDWLKTLTNISQILFNLATTAAAVRQITGK